MPIYFRDAQTTWKIYKTFNYFTEETQEKLQRMFDELLKAVDRLSPSVSKSLQQSDLSNEERRILKLTNPDNIQVEADYHGPHINGPITRSNLVDLIEAFQKGQILHEKYVYTILHQVRAILKTIPNFNRVDLSIVQHAFIIGDLHGQLADLLHIFNENGLPETNISYIFNGDFIDRGPNSVEVFLLLSVALILYPSSIFLNRGNHEDCFIALRYGFESEITHKYTKSKNVMINLFNDIFSWLPIYSIIDTGISEIIVLHGGISDQLNLERINSIARHQYISLCIQPESKSRGNNVCSKDCDDYQQIRDILWCDPDPENRLGCRKNSIRHMASFFGPDVTEKFLAENGFYMLIRSHEAKDNGYDFQHNSKVLTLFSASNYNGECNQGAFARWDYKSREPIITTYTCEDVLPIDKYSFQKQLTLFEDPFYRSLMHEILEKKDLLKREFENADKNKTGRLSPVAWNEILTKVLQIELPWMNLHSKLIKEDAQGIIYSTMFEENPSNNEEFQRSEIGIIHDVYVSKDPLMNLFNILDSDHSGLISRSEFSNAMKSLIDRNSEELFSTMIFDKNTEINLNMFLETYRIVHLKKQNN